MELVFFTKISHNQYKYLAVTHELKNALRRQGTFYTSAHVGCTVQINPHFDTSALLIVSPTSQP